MRCHTCTGEAKFVCGHCKVFAFCSHDCGDAVAEHHHAVCFDPTNSDASYVAKHLEAAIIDMHQDPDRYTDEDIADAVDVLVDLPHTLVEARALVREHLLDEIGERAFKTLSPDIQAAIVSPDETYQMFHLSHVGYNRFLGLTAEEEDLKRAKEADRNAKRLRRAAELERQSLDLQERAKKREELAARRAQKTIAKGHRRGANLKKRAQQLDRKSRQAVPDAERKARGKMTWGSRVATSKKRRATGKARQAAKLRGN